MGRTKAKSLQEAFNKLKIDPTKYATLSKWQIWTLLFHAQAAMLEVECCHAQSDANPMSNVASQLKGVEQLPDDWITSSKNGAVFKYVHAASPTMIFKVSYTEKPGGKIEVRIEKNKKSPTLMDPPAHSVPKLIEFSGTEVSLD